LTFTPNNNAALVRTLAGFLQPSQHEYLSNLVKVSATGEIVPQQLSANILKRGSKISVGSSADDLFVATGLVAPGYDPEDNIIYFIGDSMDNFRKGNSPKNLYAFNFAVQKYTLVKTLKTSGQQWTSLLCYDQGFIGIQLVKTSNGYGFTVSTIDFFGIVIDIATTVPNVTFVNFFWAQYDENSNNVYILAGDEDSLYDLDVVMYTVSLNTATSTVVTVANNQYTLANFHVDPTGTLYSVSPGLFGKSDWTIVTINPTSGAVSPVASIPASSKWDFNFGGGIYNGMSKDGRTLLHTFVWHDTQATALVLLEISSGKVLYLTDIDLGINMEQRLAGLVAL